VAVRRARRLSDHSIGAKALKGCPSSAPGAPTALRPLLGMRFCVTTTVCCAWMNGQTIMNEEERVGMLSGHHGKNALEVRWASHFLGLKYQS
jgi:hypothetical protein